jgi:metal-dependent amidase/aminoacylase/carboxypeptidase family protein
VGFSWGAVTFEGEADHAGPTPMHTRSDALVAASDFVTGVRRVPGALGDRTVATVGSVDLAPDSINIVPEEVTVIRDLRDPEDATIDEGRQRVLVETDAAATREGVDWGFEDRMRASPVDFADRCVAAVQDAADAGGHEGMGMVSGAGHDATYMTELVDTGWSSRSARTVEVTPRTSTPAGRTATVPRTHTRGQPTGSRPSERRCQRRQGPSPRRQRCSSRKPVMTPLNASGCSKYAE